MNSKCKFAVAVILGGLFISTQSQAMNGSVTYTYDALGRVLSASYDTGVIVLYTYDPNGNRTQQVVNVNSAQLCWDTTTSCPATPTGIATWDQGLWAP